MESGLHKTQHFLARESPTALGAQIFHICCREATIVGMFALLCEAFSNLLTSHGWAASWDARTLALARCACARARVRARVCGCRTLCVRVCYTWGGGCVRAFARFCSKNLIRLREL